jgi:chorismate mutase/ribosomal protein S18 acetylase RimI-like enzyme
MPTEGVVLRPATPTDLPAVADLHVRVRAAAVPSMPPGIHTREEVRQWVTGWDLAVHETWVAMAGGQLVGYCRLREDWLDDLYVDPAVQGTGIGSMLLDVAKSRRPQGFCLWVFESNAPARAFYAKRGCVELERTDGSGNEEHAPDVRVAWPGSDPVGFLRRLVDEVDAELAGLLHRRVALTHAIQPHKPDTARDPEREREIAEAMAEWAPSLGAERLERIVHTIITESLDAERHRPVQRS